MPSVWHLEPGCEREGPPLLREPRPPSRNIWARRLALQCSSPAASCARSRSWAGGPRVWVDTWEGLGL